MEPSSPGIDESTVVTNLNHKINSPLAAIRNALYLAGCRTADPKIQHYLRLAEEEVAAIAEILRSARKESAATRSAQARRAAAGNGRIVA
jgi:hypothetical protein